MAKRVTKKKVEPKKKTTAKPRPKKKVTAKKTTKATPKKKVTAKKKVTPKKKVTAKKKLAPRKPTTKKAPASVPKPTTTRRKPLKNKKSERKFIKVSTNAKAETFTKMGERVQKGEVQWAYYAIDGNVAYHYYLILKND